MMKISLILEAVNRMTAPIAAARKSIEAIGAVATSVSARMDRSFGTVTRSVEKMGAVTAAVTRSAGGSLMGMYDRTRDAAYHFRALAGEEGMGRAARGAAYLRDQVSGLTGGLTLLKYASIGAAIGLGEEFVRGVFHAGGEMQQMLVTLTRLEGSATRARGAMAWMQTFAMGPGASFSMPDIMRSYQMAQNFGMNPQGGSLAAFADFAAGERVSLKQVLFAVKDATEGTSTRPLANLGIKMKQGKGGGDNSYLYANAQGQFVRTSSAKTPEATLSTLVGIINAKYAGLAGAQAKTVPGGIAQMQKLLYLFEGKVAGAGVFDWALKQMNRFFAYVRQASADGSLDRIATRISNFMTSAGDRIIRFVTSTDWGAVAKDIGLLASTIGLLANGLGSLATIGGGGLSGLLNLFVASKIFGVANAIGSLITPLVTVTAALLGFDIAAAPIAAIVAGIALLAAAAFLVYRNWDAISAWWARTWNGLSASARVDVLLMGINPMLGLPALIEGAWIRLPAFFGQMWADIRARTPSWTDLMPAPFGMAARFGAQAGNWLAGHALGAPRLPPPGPPKAAAPAAAPHGKLTVVIQGDPSLAQVKRLQATGMDVEVKRGPVGGGG